MKTYIGTKVINAMPMTRIAYNELRGWLLPSNENGDDEGYLVEYTDGGTPNHASFSGYISWSPKEVFENTYRETGSNSETWYARVFEEREELNHKISKLSAFIEAVTSESLDEESLSLLRLQLKVMDQYSHTLTRRLDHSK